MGLTETEDYSELLKKFTFSDVESEESWEAELRSFIDRHPELHHSLTIP